VDLPDTPQRSRCRQRCNFPRDENLPFASRQQIQQGDRHHSRESLPVPLRSSVLFSRINWLSFRGRAYCLCYPSRHGPCYRGLVTIIRRSWTRFTFERVIRDEVQVGNLYGTSEADVSGCHSCRRKETRNRIISRICPFLPRVFLLGLHPSGRWLVGTVGIGPKVVLRLRKLLIFRL
jgi:hypothetical protein